MEYNFREIEKKWQQNWKDQHAYKVNNPDGETEPKPKYYVLDMFPYPSGAGLHVGHPLGYIASDIFSRYKRLKGFNVLHPMGFDSFGLPAEQYAIETGQHPAVTTENNIARYREQLDNIGFSYDWSREVRTSDPAYYKWTQYIFLQLFDSFFNRHTQKAERISGLITTFEETGNSSYECPGDSTVKFSADEWNGYNEKQQQDILMHYRLSFIAYGEVNWCEALGTVLANDEVVNGVSERGGHPVVKKKMRQWYLRITEYADRLLDGLETVDFSDSMKEMQKNWIGKSQGAEITFRLTPNPSPRGEGSEAGKPASESGHYFKTADTFQWQNLKKYGRENRKNPTEAEDLLWQALRNNQIGVKVRRQHAIQGFIADFAIMESKLVIEIDGGYHSVEEQNEYDEARTKFLKEFNIEILRFTNEQVLNSIEPVINEIKDEIGKRKSTIDSKAEVPLHREEKGPGDEAKRSATKAEENDNAGSPSPLQGEAGVRVYTTRPDTIFGVDFMVIAPEHDLVEKITTPEQKEEIDKYLVYVKSRSERERMAEVKQITGAFTGAFAINPFDGREIPIWISEYVLAGYGTGAIMAVPCGDQRDYNFAKHFNIPITNIIGDAFNGVDANPTKDAILQNSGFVNGMVMRDAIDVVNTKLEEMGIGKRKINYKMRDAGFSRQRYWGEPFPIVYKDGIAMPLTESELPVELPYMEDIKSGKSGEGPLSNLKDWLSAPAFGGSLREVNTMPGYAGSSWYFLRYMDPHNDEIFVDKKVADYWNQVDLYIGGTEHAVGHLLYSRMWTKVLCDLGYIGFDEPFKKLVNQGMIQGNSRFVFRVTLRADVDEKNNDGTTLKMNSNKNIFASKSIFEKIKNNQELANKVLLDIVPILGIENHEKLSEIEAILSMFHVDVSLVDGVELNIDSFRNSKPEYADAIFILEDGTINAPLSARRGAGGEAAKYICGAEVEKMSKSKYNVVNPDEIVERFGADTFRMYEMFLGPVEQSKPWDTKGIEGVHRFLRKFWRLFVDEEKGASIVNHESATPAELKVLHKTIKKIEEDTERFSFNTAVSTFMIAVNELNDLKCHKKEILEPLAILLTSYAPHISEEIWSAVLQNDGSVLNAVFPKYEERFLIESAKEYPVSINGKVRSSINLPLDMAQAEVEKEVLANEIVQKWLEGKQPKKIIYVKNKMINVVI